MPSGEELSIQGVPFVTIYGRHERHPPSSPLPSPPLPLSLSSSAYPPEGPLSQSPAERRGSVWKVHASQKVLEGLNQSRGRNIDKILSLADSFPPLLNGDSSQPVGVGGAGWAPGQQPGRFWSPATNQLFPPHCQKRRDCHITCRQVTCGEEPGIDPDTCFLVLSMLPASCLSQGEPLSGPQFPGVERTRFGCSGVGSLPQALMFWTFCALASHFTAVSAGSWTRVVGPSSLTRGQAGAQGEGTGC